MSDRNAAMGDSSPRHHAPTGSEGGATQPLPRRAFEHWKQAARAIGVVQTRILMFVIYLVTVLPVGLVFRLRKDPLHLRPREDGNWTPSHQDEITIDRARQQF